MSARTDWLESLDPGDVVALVVCIGGARLTAYRATIATIDTDKINLEVSTGIPVFVWRDTGCRPDYGWAILPLDAPADAPAPLDALAIDWSGA